MKALILVFAAVFILNNAGAQKKNSIIFNSYNSLGFVAGKSPIAFTAQTENGIVFKNWFFGAGVGIDEYYIKTIPLFGSVKKIIPLKSNSIFLYANAGGNIITGDKTQKKIYSTLFTKGGFYGDAGLGYKIKTGKKSNAFFSIGNTIKTITETENMFDIWGMGGVYFARHNLSRVSLKLGYQF